jgi:ribosomal protein L44E
MKLTRLRVLTLALVAVFALAGTPNNAWSAPQKGKTVHVKEYKKKDGTTVKAHDRKASKEKASGGSSTPTHATSSSTATPHVSHASHLRCESCDRDEHGRIVRSKDAKKAFEKATGFPKGRPGFVIDHIKPLACGGADLPSNMQWQTKEEAKAKDKVERRGC